MRGARHQVRAALAAAGFPLRGDTLYGGNPCPFRALCTPECSCAPEYPYAREHRRTPDASCARDAVVAPDVSAPESTPSAKGSGCGLHPEAPEFYLHHARLESPEIGAQSLPDWAGRFGAPDDLQALLLMPMPDVAA
jgi:hypothetical protein